jgi:hypothetical protein
MRRLVAALLVTLSALPAFAQNGTTIAELKDFRTVEVRGAGFTLSHEARIHVEALGGGEKGFWERWIGDDDDDDNDGATLYAGGWIIDAATRRPVWMMTLENSPGNPERRHTSDDVTLPKGSYEVYYAAHGYERRTMFSSSSVNIDRRPNRASTRRSMGIIDDDDRSDRLVERFMAKAGDYGITLCVRPEDAAAVTKFDAPMPVANAVVEVVGVGDRAVIRKTLTVARDVTLHVEAQGERVSGMDMADHGWITRADTRDRVWQMRPRDTRRGGGAVKNRKADGDVRLTKGVYELTYVTDGSHSAEDWNAKPPSDPFRYGIILTAASPADKQAVTVSEGPAVTASAHRIVDLTKVGNNDLVSAGFSLAGETRLRVTCVGEVVSRHDPADYGWIVNAKTRTKVWTMADRSSEHAGGAGKNHMIDEIITLPKGDYVAYYQTDGSHAYNDWNDDPPYEPESWGLAISGAGEHFDARSVSSFSPESERGVIAQLIKARDDARMTKRFTIDATTKVRVYALGEGQSREMFDYGWITDSRTGKVVWEMTYGMTGRAGGARKNRVVDEVITLEKGEYELHYETDGSHAFNDWNDDPPEDPLHWGISLYHE